MNLEKINYDKIIIGDCIMEKFSKVDGGVIESKYFAMKYLPSVDKSNPDLNGKCNLLISAMVMADAIGDNEDINNLMRAFSEALLACKTEEELNNFSLFMNKLAEIGGFARGFNHEVNSMISQKGKLAAQTIIQNIDKERQEKKEQVQSKDSSKLREFEQIYAKLNNELEKFKRNPMVNDRDLALLLEMYQNLLNYLHRLKGTIDDGIFAQYDGQINAIISNLNSISQTLGDIERPMKR